jgi:dihydropteroate synthase
MTLDQLRTAADRCRSLLLSSTSVYQGILNTSPDSFSDGGRYTAVPDAVRRALELVKEGARIIDVGGVSTRPGAEEIPADVELARVIPVLRAIRKELPEDVLVSLDTSSPTVAARAAQENLIDLINDVFAARKKETLDLSADATAHPLSPLTTADVAARFQLGLILMHMQGNPQTMQRSPAYTECVSDVCEFLKKRVSFAKSAGVAWLAVDPGIGFGKTLDDNLALLSVHGMEKLSGLGEPLLIGLSRKSFLKALAERSQTLPHFSTPHEELCWRDKQSDVWEKRCVSLGARIIRTHAVRKNF